MARGRFYVGAKGVEFRNRVIDIVHAQFNLDRESTRRGRLGARVDVYPPDRRKRDLDNVLKAIFDALTHAGVYVDDSQIRYIRAEMLDRVKGGKAIVTISEH